MLPIVRDEVCIFGLQGVDGVQTLLCMKWVILYVLCTLVTLRESGVHILLFYDYRVHHGWALSETLGATGVGKGAEADISAARPNERRAFQAEPADSRVPA